MKQKNIIYLTLIISLVASSKLDAMFPINFSRGYDPHLKPPYWGNITVQLSGWGEAGFFTRGVNGENDEVNVLQIWQRNQNALAMLQGFSPDSPMTQLWETIKNNAGQQNIDNDVRGHLIPCGDFKYRGGGGVTGRYHLNHNFSLAAYGQFYSLELKNVTFLDKTGGNSPADIAVREDLTDNFLATIKALDPSLNLDGWRRSGPGDLIFMAEWLRHFPQLKPILRDVVLNVRAGSLIPLSLKKNEDDILSVPFGFDGSSAIIFGGGIAVNWFNLINGGADIELTHFFGNTRERRIKVHPDQTELLFLAKVPAHKDFGLTQRYNLFLEADRFYRGFSFGAAYQYWRHGEDKLALCSHEFSTEIANTAESLQEWTIHQMIITLSYDMYADLDDDAAIKPHIRLFYRFPFNGQRAILSNTAGVMLTFNF